MAKRKGVSARAARGVLLALPGVEEGPCYGTPGFRVRGKFLARLRDNKEYDRRGATKNALEAPESSMPVHWSTAGLAIRSIAWTLLLPGFFAGYLPWRYFGVREVQLSLRSPVHLFGLLSIALGAGLLGTCIFEFARTGRGTLAPVDPPRELVVRGLYRYIRNPMYLSVTLIVLGEVLLTGSRPLLVYWALWFLAANLFVIGYEEPTLRQRFGEAYDRYSQEVGRWLPRLGSREPRRLSNSGIFIHRAPVEIVHNAHMELGRILVPTDFSDAAGRAFEQALALAGPGPAEILVLHRVPSPVPVGLPPPADLGMGGFEGAVPLLDEYAKEAREHASVRLRELEGRASEGVRIETAIEETREPWEAILRKASEWRADLVVMGTHGRRGLDKLLMGSVASAVLHRSEVNVMVLRADAEIFALRALRAAGKGSEPDPILVPVDFSDGSHRALALARSLASRYGARLHLLHVVELLHTPLEPGGLSSRFEGSPELRGKYEKALRGMLGETEGEIHLAEGTVAGEILWWREKLGARLVVMGSRGLTGLKHLLMGSIAEKVSRFSEVPVLVVK